MSITEIPTIFLGTGADKTVKFIGDETKAKKRILAYENKLIENGKSIEVAGIENNKNLEFGNFKNVNHLLEVI